MSLPKTRVLKVNKTKLHDLFKQFPRQSVEEFNSPINQVDPSFGSAYFQRIATADHKQYPSKRAISFTKIYNKGKNSFNQKNMQGTLIFPKSCFKVAGKEIQYKKQWISLAPESFKQKVALEREEVERKRAQELLRKQQEYAKRYPGNKKHRAASMDANRGG
jgi:hypothetical protein